MPEPNLSLDRREFSLVLIALFAGAVVAAFLKVRLAPDLGPHLADAAGRLVEFPVLILLLAPVLVRHRSHLRRVLNPSRLTLELAILGVASALLVRLAYWFQITARGLFGWLETVPGSEQLWPQIWLACPSAAFLIPTILSLAGLTPLAEELVYRGLIMSRLRQYGPRIALIGTTTLFTVMHRPEAWPWVFIMGLLFAMQYRCTGSLWLPLITHAVFNGLAQLDFFCLKVVWHVDASVPGHTVKGLLAASLAFLLTAAAFRIATGNRVRAQRGP